MATSSIEWTELTWNPTTGCDKVSAGCKFCYAEIMSRRLKAIRDQCEKHDVAFFFKQWGGPQQEGGWQGTGRSPSRHFSKAKEAAAGETGPVDSASHGLLHCNTFILSRLIT